MRGYIAIISAVILTLSAPVFSAKPDCPADEEQAFFPYDGDCTKYWECTLGSLYVFECPNGLYWNQAILQCDFAENVDCDSTRPTDSTTSIPQTSTTEDWTTYPPTRSTTEGGWSTNTPTEGGSTTEGGWTTDLPTESTTEGGWTTDLPTESTTEGGWTTDLPTESTTEGGWTTDLPTESTTEGGWTTTYPPTEITTEGGLTTYPPTEEPATTDPNFTPDPMCPYPSDTETFFPYDGDCTKYWMCFEGNKFEYQCPENLYWNQDAGYCDYWENVHCTQN